MAPIQSKLRQALGVVKDQTSISLAKVASNHSADLDVLLVKATSHDDDDIPMDSRYVHEIIHVTSDSPSSTAACVAGLARRLLKTHDWIVALKCLMLLLHLIRQGGQSFQEEILVASRRGVSSFLNLSNFKDEAHSNSWDFSAFVRTYSSFLVEKIDWYADYQRSVPSVAETSGSTFGGSRRGSEERQDNPRMKVNETNMGMLLDRLHRLQRLLGRVLACRPVGLARCNRLVLVSLYPVVSESFELYSDVCDGLTLLLDGFFDMDQPDRFKAVEVYSRAAKQVDELASFYDLCRQIGVCSSDEYPSVQKIPQEHLDALQNYGKDRSIPSSAESKVVLALPPSTRSVDSELDLKAQERTPPSKSVPDRKPQYSNVMRRGTSAKALPRLVVGSSSSASNLLPTSSPSPPTLVSASDASPMKGGINRKQQDNHADLLNLEKATVSVEEQEERLALALFASNTGTTITTNWETFASAGEQESDGPSAFSDTGFSTSQEGKPGWELALVSSSPSKPSTTRLAATSSLAGGFDHLLLDSMYDQAETRQKFTSSSAPAGSASSMARPGASSFLALPGPAGSLEEADPFAASASIPPPAYVQMADLKQKQGYLLQEQQLWQQYKRDGMLGQYGLMNLQAPACNAQLPPPPAPAFYPPYYNNYYYNNHLTGIPSYAHHYYYAAHY